MRIVDLSVPYDPEYSTPMNPYLIELGLYKIEKTFTFGREGFVDHQFTLNCHVGTHIDAPMHFLRREEKKGMYSLDDIPLERLYGETLVLDIPKGENEPITAEDFEKARPKVQEGDRVLVHTGWGRYFVKEPKNAYYIFHKGPGLEVSGAEWLVKKKIILYGQDTIGTQHKKHSFFLTQQEKESGLHPAQHTEPVHRMMLEHDIPLVEELTNLDLIAGRRVLAGFFPLPFKGIEASPIRALAFLDD